MFAYCTHGVLSGGAAARVAKSELTELVVTDTIYRAKRDPKDSKIRRLTIAPLFGEAIRRIADESSVAQPVRLKLALHSRLAAIGARFPDRWKNQWPGQ